MSTLDNLNENILQKIDIIDKITNICKNNLLIPLYDRKLENHLNIFDLEYWLFLKDLNVPLSFIQNIKILNKRYNYYLDCKYIYEVQSILFLTEYYSITNNKVQSIRNNIYNDNIFLLSSDSTILNNNDILLLKNIYYNNYYKYKYFLTFDKIVQNSNSYKKYSDNISKKLYHKFNIFISSEDIYGIFDNYIDFLFQFLTNFKSYILKLHNEPSLDSNENEILIDKHLKKIYQLINQFKKTKLIYSIDEIEYDLCSCGNKMIIQSNTSELLCTKCGAIHTLIGSVFEDSQFYNQEGNRYLHGTYDPNRHCKFWIDRIQAKENTIIEESIINKIKLCIKKDKIENLKNISIEQFRIYLKQCKLSKLNDHIPLIKKIITGYIPPQLTHKELHLLFNYFDKATKIYNQIKPKEKSNSLYYPFLIWKILDLIIENQQKKKELLACIHLQSYETLIDNDKIWYQICKHNDKFIYKPTDKSILY